MGRWTSDIQVANNSIIEGRLPRKKYLNLINGRAMIASQIVKSILGRIGQPGLLSVLKDLSGTDLNSILLEVFNEKTRSLTAPALLNRYQQNRFVKPADLPALELRRIEWEVLQLFAEHGFTAIDLAPVTALGSCSVVGPADQKKILSALRGTEVLADNTNAIALHVSDLKQNNAWTGDVMRFCNIQRMVRTQAITGKGFTPHFRVASLVSCGSDSGAYAFEKQALNEHMDVIRTLFLHYYKLEAISFRLLARTGYPENFLTDMSDFLRRQNAELQITTVEHPEKDNQYYKGIQYKADISYKGKTYEIADGGFVDWTQRLLQNKKERMFTTGFGFDFIYRILHGGIG
jgi:hypothetical protein